MSALTLCDPTAGADEESGLAAELARSRTARVFAPRLSIPVEYQPCTVHSPSDRTILQTDCQATPTTTAAPDEILNLAARASAAVGAEADPDALHAAALIDLLWSQSTGNSLQRSISFLQKASRLSHCPARILSDLTAAYLVRAERTHNVRDLLEAIEVAEQATECEPENPAALFNRALALDRLGLTGQATEAWRQLLVVDSESGWAREASDRMDELSTEPPPQAPPLSAATAYEIESFVAGNPQEARLLGLDRVLGEWGDAVLKGDTAGAEDRLRLAGALGTALERRGGDASLADAVRAIRARTGSRTATRTLADAHREYARGRARVIARDMEAAHRSFDRALLAADDSEPLRKWAKSAAGAALLETGHTELAERVLREAIEDVDTLRHPSLAGHARWARGTALMRSGRYEEGLSLVRGTAGLFERADERENLGAIRVLAGAAEYLLGDMDAMHGSMHQALVTLRSHRGSPWLHNLLYIWADAAAAAGYTRAALYIQNEGVVAATRTGEPAFVVEARLARARLLIHSGDASLALQDVAASRRPIEQVPPGTVRDWLRADLWLAVSGAAMSEDPYRAAVALDSVVAFFEAIANPARLLPALVARAEARLATGRHPAAEADLSRAMALLDEQQASTAVTSLRASLLDAARQTVDRLVMLRVAGGHATDALTYLERGRVSFAPVRAGPYDPALEILQLSPGQTALDYALIGDTLLIWTIADGTVRLTRTNLDRASLIRTIDRVLLALELRTKDTATMRDLAALYDWLIRPVRSRLGPEGTPLVIVADGEIAGIPFSALYDSIGKQYLVEGYPLRFASSLRDAFLPQRVRSGPATGVLLVSDPAFDPRRFPGLGRLPGVVREVDAIAAEYPNARILVGPDADRAAFEEALRKANVIHYGGHAIFDDDQPLRSHLVLAAPRDGRNGSAVLSAADIERLDLRSLRLVVLSACQTSRVREGRSGGFAGLAGAFLAAGAGGVIGSLWRVDDDLTRSLMIGFHRDYRASGDAVAALRSAQLRMLRSADPAQQSPAAWAGFRFVGS